MKITALLMAAAASMTNPDGRTCIEKHHVDAKLVSYGFQPVGAGVTDLGHLMQFYLVPGVQARWSMWIETPDRKWMCSVAWGEGWRYRPHPPEPEQGS